jgi:DNA-binding MarR family transcriptional regulator
MTATIAWRHAARYTDLVSTPTTTPIAIESPRPVHLVARELADSTGFLLVRLGFALKALAGAAVEGIGSEVHDYGVLAILGEGARETQATIADALDLDPSRLVALLDSLEERGLVVRQRDPQDRRRHLVSITAAGQDELTRLRVLMKGLEDEFFAPLDRDSRETLHELLLALAAQNDPRCCPFTSPDAT